MSAVGDGTYVGTVNGSLTRVTGPALPEPKSPWPGARGGGQAANAAARPGTGILVKGHRVPFTPYNHASIRVAPTNIGRWYEGNPDLFYLRNAEGSIASPNIDSYGNRFFTFGAGPDAANDTGSACLLYPHQIIGTLAGGINRPADVRESPAELARAHYSPLLENLLIERLLASNARYKNDLGYACLPEFEAPGYNSNSYAAGLLNATRIAPPSFPLVRQNGLPCGGVNPVACEVYPGWTKPVPADSFR